MKYLFVCKHLDFYIKINKGNETIENKTYWYKIDFIKTNLDKTNIWNYKEKQLFKENINVGDTIVGSVFDNFI